MKSPKLLATTTVAHIFECSDDTVRRLARNGEISFQLDSNGRMLFDEESVRRCAAKRKRLADTKKTKNAVAA